MPSDKIEKLTLVSDVSRPTGREICYDNLYIDGVRVQNIASGTGLKKTWRPLKNTVVDQLLDVGAVLAVEMYRVSDIPEGYNMTMPANTASCGATLIWTK